MKIEKEVKVVIVYTCNYRIKCDMHTPPGSRFSDFMGGLGQRQFIPVSNAVVTDIFGNLVCKAKFLEMNVNEIIFLIPEEDMASK